MLARRGEARKEVIFSTFRTFHILSPKPCGLSLGFIHAVPALYVNSTSMV